MKNNFILYGILFALFSTPVSALELYKARIIKEKEWLTRPGKGSYVTSHQPNDFIHTRKSFESNSLSVTGSSAEPNNGSVNELIQLKGRNIVYIVNQTHQARKYEYEFKICAHILEPENCLVKTKEVVIERGGFIHVDEEGTLQIKFAKPGKYFNDVTTRVIYHKMRGQDENHSASRAFVNIS